MTTIRTSGLVDEYAAAMGLQSLSREIELNSEDVERRLVEVRRQHPEETPEQQYARAVARELWFNYPRLRRGAPPEPPQIQPPQEVQTVTLRMTTWQKFAVYLWMVLALALLGVIAARGQGGQGPMIEALDEGVRLRFFAAGVFRWNCIGAGVTCTWNSVTRRVDLTVAGGGGAVFSVFGRTGDVVAAANDYSWTQIASKPSTFPPDAHGHAEADVTNLVTDLAAKVPTGRRIDTTTPLQGGDNLTADRTFSILQAGSGQSGYLSSTDWSLFNGKQAALSFPLTLTQGGTNQNSWTAARCVRVNAGGTALEVAAADCGTGGGGITTLNTLTDTTQTFAAPGTTGTAPNWVSAAGVHTLHIPLATTASVTAGLISKSEFDIFNGKESVLTFDSPLSRAVNTITCPTCSVSGHAHAEADVTNLVTDLAAKEATANKNAASGYAGLDGSTKLAAAQLPNPAPTTLGGVKSSTCSGNDKVTGIDATGAATCGTDQATGTGPTFARVTADVQNTTTTFADIPGLTFAVAIGTNTSFACELFYTTAVITTALQLAINGPASPAAMRYAVLTSTTATAMHSASQSAYNTNTNPANSLGATAVPARISGTLENGGTAGTLAIRFRSEIAASAVNVLRGSYCMFVTY